jgi:hypothetical protein
MHQPVAVVIGVVVRLHRHPNPHHLSVPKKRWSRSAPLASPHRLARIITNL